MTAETMELVEWDVDTTSEYEVVFGTADVHRVNTFGRACSIARVCPMVEIYRVDHFADGSETRVQVY